MPVRRNAHQTQLAATPPTRTKLVTRFGVSVLNVVATMETPISHHGAARPEVKNSAVFCPARRAIHSAGIKETKIETATMIQSNEVSRTAAYMCRIGTGGAVFQPPRVKSGTSTGADFRATDCTVRPTTALMAAASYTLKSVGVPSRRHLIKR